MKKISQLHGQLHKKILKYYRESLLAIALVGFLFLIIVSPITNQATGNVFFGKVPALYNVTLAQFFFTQSAYPVFGKPVEYAHYQLSRTYFIQGDLATAFFEAKKELETYPSNTRTYYILGLTYGYMNEEDKAIEAFGKFIEANPMSWAARNDKAWLQFRIGDIDGALATIEPVAYDTNNPWIQNTYGTLLMNKKIYDKARKAFLNAQKATDAMSEESWGIAYPGNDPRIYGTGLNAMRLSIKNNLKLLENK